MEDRFRVRAWDEIKKCYLYNIQNKVWCVNGKRLTFLDALNRKLIKGFIPEQCTGIKDDSGNLIYEGDIIEYKAIREYTSPIKKECVINKRDKIIAKNGYFNLVSQLNSDNMKIIGNIHENKELLK